MAIKKGNELNYADKHLTLIIQGSPGVGKSTLAQSAPNVLTFDFDNGMCRVKPHHRKDTSICSTFEEVKQDIAAAKGQYDTIVIDTGGALVDMMKQYVIDNPKDFKGGAKATGGISLQGFGFVKQIWNDFSRELRKNFNVVYIFHESATKNGDDGMFYEIVVEGSTRNTVYQSADLAARLFINNGQRYLGFTPTEQYSAKACFGISGLVSVPELKDGDENNFLAKLFAKVRANLAAESAALAPQKDAYTAAIEAAKQIVDSVSDPAHIAPALKALAAIPHAMTSEKEAKAMLKRKMADLGIEYDKGTKEYKFKE